MKAILNPIGIFIFLANLQVQASLLELPSLDRAVPCISSEDDKPNLIASRLFGQWKKNEELTNKFGPYFNGGEIEISIAYDENVLELFDNRFGCAYAHGTMTMVGKDDDGKIVLKFQSPFMLISQNGNPLLIVEAGEYSGNGPIEHPHRNYVSLAAAPDVSHDLLFLGKHIGHDFVVLGRIN